MSAQGEKLPRLRPARILRRFAGKIGLNDGINRSESQRPHLPAWKANLLPGDVIVGPQGEPIIEHRSPHDFVECYKDDVLSKIMDGTLSIPDYVEWLKVRSETYFAYCYSYPQLPESVSVVHASPERLEEIRGIIGENAYQQAVAEGRA